MGGVIVLGAQAWAVTVSNNVINVTMFMEGEVQGFTNGNAFAAPVNLTERDLMNLALGLRPRTSPHEQVALGLVQLANTNTLPLIVFNSSGRSNVVTIGSITLDPDHPTQLKSNATVFVQVDLLNVGGVTNRIVSGQFFFAGTTGFQTNGSPKKLSCRGVGTLSAQFSSTNTTDLIIYKAQFRTSGNKLGIITNAPDFDVFEAGQRATVEP
jgi:hypothetical protein